MHHIPWHWHTSYDSIDVYIDKKYRPGSCQYNSVLDHERQHVVVFLDTLDQAVPGIELRLRNTVKAQDSVITDDQKLGIKILQARIEKVLKPLMRKINKRLDVQNGAFDTVKNYKREQKNCLTW